MWDGKRSAAQKARRRGWSVAEPVPGLRVYGRQTPVRLALTPRVSSELWIEVEYGQGRFWVHYDVSVMDLVTRVQQGGFRVAPPRHGRSKA